MKRIHELLDIDDESNDGTKKQEIIDVEPELVPSTHVAPAANKDEIEIQSIDDDFDRARENILDSLNTAKTAIEYMFVIAKDREDSKSFDSLNSLVKSVMEGSKDLLTIYKTREEYKEKKHRKNAPAEINIDKAIFTGTPMQLKKFIKGEE